jgi:hypothetical protein
MTAWRSSQSCRFLSNSLSRHLVGLNVLFKKQGQVCQELYTGFALYHRERLMWVTAGHVVDEIGALISSADFEVIGAAWLDGCDISGAEGIPAGDLTELIRFSATPLGYDFGVISLDKASLTLLNSPYTQFLTHEIWGNSKSTKVIGYYLLGFPRDWRKSTVRGTKARPRRMTAELQAAIACVPLARTDREVPVCRDDFWDHPTGFYARVLPYSDGADDGPRDLRGTSGGPIFSIEVADDGSIEHRLFGIQVAWVQDKQVIRAESIEDIVAIMAPASSQA